MRHLARHAWVVLAAATSGSASGTDATTVDADGITRLAPSRTRTLPRAYVRDLTRRGCALPQSVLVDRPLPDIDNVIVGSFARRGQRDHAVLCSIDGVSHVDVSWGGGARCASTPESSSDHAALADGRDGKRYGYGRWIHAASPTAIRSDADAFGGPRPPGRPHDGIESGDEKGSMIHCCLNGEWTTLAGMD